MICPVLHSRISDWTRLELRSFYPPGAMLVCFDPTIYLSCLKAAAQHVLLTGSTQLIRIAYPKVKSLPSRQITQCSLSQCSDNWYPCCSPLWSKSSADATLKTHSCTYFQVIFVLKEEEVNCRHSTFYSEPLSLLTSIKLVCPSSTLKDPNH